MNTTKEWMVDVSIHVFFTSALIRDEWSLPLLSRVKSHWYPLDRMLVDPRADLGGMMK
jgi:hypothetical protein